VSTESEEDQLAIGYFCGKVNLADNFTAMPLAFFQRQHLARLGRVAGDGTRRQPNVSPQFPMYARLVLGLVC
jgi:hypothetical protein